MLLVQEALSVVSKEPEQRDVRQLITVSVVILECKLSEQLMIWDNLKKKQEKKLKALHKQ